MAETGPYDGVIAFSEGAALVASLLIYKIRQNGRQQRLFPLFKFAIFFCGGVPVEPATSPDKKWRAMDSKVDGEIIEIPTAHIWGEKDSLWPSFGIKLSQLCMHDQRTVFVHKGGHEIPGAKSSEDVAKTVRTINRTIEKAMTAQ